MILKLFFFKKKVTLDETHLKLVGYEQDCPAFSNPHDSFLEDVGAHTGIDSAEGIIQKKNGPLTVEGPSQAQSLALPSTQVDAPLSNLEKSLNLSLLEIT